MIDNNDMKESKNGFNHKVKKMEEEIFPNTQFRMFSRYIMYLLMKAPCLAIRL